MLTALWSIKGGVGTTLTAAALAIAAARANPAGALLVDLAGEAAMVAGVEDPAGFGGRTGVHDWLASGPSVPHDALARLEVSAAPGLALLPHGQVSAAPMAAERAGALCDELAATERTVVVDCGVLADASPVPAAVVGAAGAALLVLRNCYVGVRRATGSGHHPAAGVVVVEEPGRALSAADVGAVLSLPVVARIPYDPRIARGVDAGLLRTGLPRPLERAVRRLVDLRP